MAKGFSIEVKGLKELQKKIGRIPENVKQEVDGEMGLAANDYVNLAIQAAPHDEGILRQHISAKRNKELDYEVVSAASWSAYIEFGTKHRVKIPSDLTAYAAQFKGSNGGSGQGFYDSILAWVKRKGITGTYSVKTRKQTGNKLENQIEAEQVAFAIYLSIIRHGVKPHPFFFQHRERITKELMNNINPAIENALRK